MRRIRVVLRREFVKRALVEFATAINDTMIVPDGVIAQWRACANRSFVDDIEVFPPLALGRPPSVETDAFFAVVDLHADRGGEEYFLRFLRAIAAKNGTTAGAGERLGVVWAENRPGFAFDNTGFLTVIAASSFGRGNHIGGRSKMVLPPESQAFPIQRVAGQLSVHHAVKQSDLGFNREATFWRTFAHELSHFVLHDDYVEAPIVLKPTADPSGTMFDDDPNVLSLGSVLVPSTEQDFPGGKISGDLIKWRWPRIRKAAVIDGIIAAGAGGFTVPVVHGQGLRFTRELRVRFRSRTPRVPLKRFDRNVDVSTEEFTVVSDPTPLGDLVTIAPRTPPGTETVTTLGRFGPGSLLFEPVDPPSTIPRAEYPYAELLTDVIRRRITSSGRPLTAWPCDAAFEFAHKGEVQIPSFDGFRNAIFSRRNSARAVGLYSGGAGYACGVFHPTGLCMMRNQADFLGIDEFCIVCRYLLVDILDPTRHAAIEAVLAGRKFE